MASSAVQRESCPELPRKTPSQIHGGITGNLSVLSLYCFQPAGVASNPLRIFHICQCVKLARTFAPRTAGETSRTNTLPSQVVPYNAKVVQNFQEKLRAKYMAE